MPQSPGSVTRLLQSWRAGDEAALAALTPLVHRELQRIARHCMRRQRAHHSLQATALVHEAYLRLVNTQQVNWQNRAHFLAMAARLMRRILVDVARSRRSRKRGGDPLRVLLHDELVTSEKSQDLVALDEALQALAELHERKSQVVELRFFGGLSVEETAAVLEVSPQTVMRDWKLARAWLRRELEGSHADDA
jgi:RNA polymerase sigma factor (TIGR02999 family)